MASDNLTGQLLGQYELRELLGVGGMGSVYRGFQTALKREVAIKVLPSTLAQQTGYMERFTREAETAAALEHPHIVPIVDYGTQRGISYVVMRLLTGGTLADRISHTQAEGRGLPSLGETAKLLRELGSALDYAHNRGVIHRDIKTSNVMFDNQGNAYLVDFGIAKLMHATNKLTGTGVAVGTPTYMAPEQWSGEEVFPATDQYSLAVLAYITVTGREPFEASTPFQLLNKHLHEMPTPLTVIRGDLPPALDLVLSRALAKDPKARFQSCTAFAQAFESAIEGNKGSETNFFVFKVPPKKQAVFAPPPVGTPPQYVPTANMYPTPIPMPKRNTGLLLGMSVIILALVGVIIALIASGGGGDANKSDIPTDTSVPAVVILASDEPIITPPNMTATSEIIMTMTGIAEQMIATQSAVPEILPTDVPATRTAFPSFTPIIPTNTPLPSFTPVPPTNTPLPSFTPVPPTNTALPSSTPVPPTDIPLSTITLTINGLGVWVKESPEADGRRLGSLINITVEVLGISADGEWYAVPYQDGIGWVQKSSNAILNGDERGLEVIGAPAITLTVNELGVWVKESPDSDVRPLGSLINITVEVLGISADGEWYAVPYQDGIGWVQKSSNAILNGDERGLEVIGAPAITLTVNGLGVWVKETPEADGRRLGSLISITVEVLGISADGEWYAVPYQDGIGWVAKSSNIELNGFESRLEVIEVQAVNDPITITVNGLGVWVKESPEADGRRLGSFINITVEVLGISADGEWYAVPYQDGIGWVQKSSNAILNGDESQLVVITP